MNIAIIGTGNVGKALASSLSHAGHQVTLAARDADKTAATAHELGVAAADSTAQAAEGADIIILAVPGDALGSVAGDLGVTASGKAVVDASNRMQPDLTGPSNAETLQHDLPDANVVKAFNTSFASRQADPEIDGLKPDAYVAADDAGAKARVLELVESIGFNPVDAGPLTAARTLEGLGWLNISRNIQGGTWQGALVYVEPGKAKAA